MDSCYLYNECINEINLYFEFLFDVLDKWLKFKFFDEEKEFDRDLIYILKVNVYFVVYNFIEFIVCNVIEDIYINLKVEIEFCVDKLNIEFVKRVFKKVSE